MQQEDREIQSLIIQAGQINSESQQLRQAIEEFSTVLRRGMLRSTVQGMAMIIIGIMLAVSFLGLLAQTYTCDAENLSHQKGSGHYKVCAVIFPQIVPQVANIQKQAAAAKQAAEDRQRITEERQKTNHYLEENPLRVACVLKIKPEDRTDQNVTDCLSGKTR